MLRVGEKKTYVMKNDSTVNSGLDDKLLNDHLLQNILDWIVLSEKTNEKARRYDEKRKILKI